MEKLFTSKKPSKPSEAKQDSKLLSKRKPNKGKPLFSDSGKNKGKGKKKRRKLRPEEKLKASQFRLLNEFLYTNSSKTSQEYFQKRQADFKVVRFPLTPVP